MTPRGQRPVHPPDAPALISTAGELKTKPTQHSVKRIAAHRHPAGHPALPLRPRDSARGAAQARPLLQRARTSAVIEAHDARTIYEVPALYHAAGLDREVLAAFGSRATRRKPDMRRWDSVLAPTTIPRARCDRGRRQVYGLKDAYKSLIEALTHGGTGQSCARASSTGSRAKIFESADPAPRLREASTAFWCRAASARAAPRARSWRRDSRASARCPISASVSACRWRSSRPPVRSPDCPRPIQPNSARRPIRWSA